MKNELPIEVHPAANIFPMMTRDEYEALKADIKEHGVHVPMTFYGGMLLDGRNRYRACLELGIDPTQHDEELDIDLVPDPIAWVLSTNLHRRHLSETQRGSIAAKIAKLRVGDVKSQRSGGQICPPSIESAATQLNVSIKTVKNAKAAIAGGCQELVDAMDHDEIKADLAAKFVKAVPDERKQRALIQKGVEAVRQSVKDWSTEKKQEKLPAAVIASVDDDQYEDVADDESQDRIGDAIREIESGFEPYEWRVIGERLILDSDNA